MSTFTVYSAGCPTCTGAVTALKDAIAQRGCGCSVEEVSCDGQCDTAKQMDFEDRERPVIVRDDEVVHSGALSEEQAARLLPAK